MFEFHHIDLAQTIRLEKAERERMIRDLTAPRAHPNRASRRFARMVAKLGGLLISLGLKLQGRSMLVVQEARSRKR